MSSFLLLSGLFFYQCQKTDLSTVPAEKQKSENTFNTGDVQDFVAKMNAIKKGDLTIRSGSYTLAELLNNVSNGINFEYNHPSTFQNKKFQFVTFTDAGSAYGGAFSPYTSIKLLTSVGVGIRLQTPIGPIRLDVGKGSNGIKTSFGIGPMF